MDESFEKRMQPFVEALKRYAEVPDSPIVEHHARSSIMLVRLESGVVVSIFEDESAEKTLYLMQVYIRDLPQFPTLRSLQYGNRNQLQQIMNNLYKALDIKKRGPVKKVN